MSDIRTKLLLGTTLSALAMIFVMAVGVDAFDTKTTTASQPLSLYGHVTVWALHPDGSSSYAQGDNTITTSEDGIRQLVDASFTSDPFNCIDIGTGNGAGPGVTALAGGTTPFCDPTSNGANEATGTHVLVGTFTISAANVGGAGGTETISEAELANTATQVISTVPLAANVGVIEGSIITINYTMTLG